MGMSVSDTVEVVSSAYPKIVESLYNRHFGIFEDATVFDTEEKQLCLG